MLVKDFLPNPAFSDFVQRYTITDFAFDKNTDVPVKLYPAKPEEYLHFFIRDGGEAELVSSSRTQHRSAAVLAGQQTYVMRLFPGKNFLSLKIVFQPTGLFRLTGIPSYELTNKYLNAENIFSKNISFVSEQLQAARDYKEMLIIAEKFVDDLISRSKKDMHLLDVVSNLMIWRDGNTSLDWMAKESCLCPKQFKRKFYERVGVNPKTYVRIIRLIKAYNIKNAYPHWDWLRIAMACGYYDHQHLVKEYKLLTGLTPNEFHFFESNSPESVLGLAKELYRSRVKKYRLS